LATDLLRAVKMDDKKVFRIILLLAIVASASASILIDSFEGKRVEYFVFITMFFVLIGYVGHFLLLSLNWIAFGGSDGDGLRLVPFILKILFFPFIPFIALFRYIFRKRREAAARRREEKERPERERQALERANAEREAAYWASPAAQEVRAAQALADIELKKSLALANLSIREQEAALETARLLRQEEEERERRRIELIKSM